jgi:hypothetical protein
MGIEVFEDKVAARLEQSHKIDVARVGEVMRDCGDQVFLAYLKGQDAEELAQALAAMLERAG